MKQLFSNTAHYVPSVIFIALLAIIHMSGSNQPLFLWLNHITAKTPDAIWANLTLIADAATGFAVMTLLIKRFPNLVYWAIWGGVISAISINLMKSGFSVSRPPAVLSMDAFNNIGPALTSGSFPSGHTTTAFFVAALISSIQKSWRLTVVCLLGALVLGLSRIAVGVHWPADVMAGAAFGWALGITTGMIARNTAPIGAYRRIFTIVICLIGSLYLFSFDSKLPHVTALQWSIALVCSALAVQLLYSEIRTLKGKFQ